MKPKDHRILYTGLVGLGLLSCILAGCSERPNLTDPADYTEPEMPLTLGTTYNMELSINDFSNESFMYRPYLKDFVGSWELKLDKTGNFSASNRNFLFEGLFSVTPYKIIFYGTNWLTSCFNTLNENEVSYSWHISGQELALISLEDDCFNRSLVLTAHSWLPYSNTPKATPPVLALSHFSRASE